MISAMLSAEGKASPPPQQFNIIPKIAYLLGARWFQEALQTVFFIYLARVSAATYGEFMMALGLGSILLMVVDFGLNLPFVGLATGSREKVNDVLSQVFILKGLFFLLALSGMFIFISWQDYSTPLKRLLFIISSGVALEAIASTFFVVLQVEGRQDQEAKIRTLGTTIGFGYGLLALFFGAAPLVTAFFKLIDSLVKLGGGIWLLLRRRRFTWLWPTVRKLLSLAHLGLIFAAMEITASIYNKGNLFFLQKYGGAESVAHYSAAWQVIDGFSSVVSGLVLQNILYPVFVRLWNQNRPAVIPLAQNTAKWLLALSLPLMFFFWMESDRLILLIFGKSYNQAVWVQEYLAITIIIAFWHNLAVFLLLSMGREKMVLGFYLIGLVVNLLVCSLILPLSPLLGATLAIILTKGIVAVFTITTAQRRLNFLAGRDLRQVAGTLAVAIFIYLATKNLPFRIPALLLTISPFFALMGWWWRAKRKAQSF